MISGFKVNKRRTTFYVAKNERKTGIELENIENKASMKALISKRGTILLF